MAAQSHVDGGHVGTVGNGGGGRGLAAADGRREGPWSLWPLPALLGLRDSVVTPKLLLHRCAGSPVSWWRPANENESRATKVIATGLCLLSLGIAPFFSCPSQFSMNLSHKMLQDAPLRIMQLNKVR